MRADVGGLQLYYEMGGVAGAPPVLFISGTGGDLRARPGPMESPLASAFALLAYDHRGLGQSDVPSTQPTMADFADDAAAILDVVGWASASVLGVSFGGMVAQELALRHPDRVDRLVLACTSAGGDGGSSYPLHELAGLDVDERIERILQLADSRLDDGWRTARPDAWDQLVAFQRARAAVGAGEPGRELGATLQLEARRHHDTWARLAGITCPTLVCSGRHDGIAPPANGERLAAAIPGATSASFDGGHAFLLQDPAAYTRVTGFLRGDA